MKTIVLATGNKHKLEEFQKMLAGYKILSLKDIGFSGDIEENGKTLEENSKIKATTIVKFLKSEGKDYAVLADDSGLCVNALGGAPGVHSARFGADHNDESNRQRLLFELQGKTDRTAYFECDLCFIQNDKISMFVGRTYGKITAEKIGDDSFGYDCLFLSDDLGKTFGESSNEEKNSVSHRGRAVQKLKEYLDNN